MDKPENVIDHIMQYMKSKIDDGSWAIGEKIPSENELCRELGYSRTSIRSAIQRYNVLGILKSEQGKGTFVCLDQVYLPDQRILNASGSVEKIEMKNYLTWLQARKLIEPEIAYAVAQNATPELVKKLRQINYEQHNAIGNSLLYNQKEMEFHITIAEAYGNPIISNIIHQILGNPNMLTYGNDKFGFLGGIYYHFLITDAIARHDAKEAKKLMDEHDDVKKRVENFVQTE